LHFSVTASCLLPLALLNYEIQQSVFNRAATATTSSTQQLPLLLLNLNLRLSHRLCPAFAYYGGQAGFPATGISHGGSLWDLRETPGRSFPSRIKFGSTFFALSTVSNNLTI